MTLAKKMLRYKGEQIQPSALEPAVVTMARSDGAWYLHTPWGALVKLRASKGVN